MTLERTNPRLDADLAALRTALRKGPAPAISETTLRETFRVQAARLDEAAETAPRHARSAATARRRRQALAAGVALVAVGVLVAVTARDGAFVRGRGASPERHVTDARVHETGAAPAPDSELPRVDAQALAEFEPLVYGPGISPTAAYSVVRVRIPLSSLAIHAAGVDGVIEAELLVGEDGLASGIRFDPANTLLVSAAQ